MPTNADRDPIATPITDHLWLLGFTLKSKVERLAVEIADGDGNTFKTTFEITAYPERGEARKLFAAKGPAKAEVKSNLPLEMFALEQDRKRTRLKHLYTEQCAAMLFEMLRAQVPTIRHPTTVGAAA
jgi:hypothetical protein